MTQTMSHAIITLLLVVLSCRSNCHSSSTCGGQGLSGEASRIYAPLISTAIPYNDTSKDGQYFDAVYTANTELHCLSSTRGTPESSTRPTRRVLAVLGPSASIGASLGAGYLSFLRHKTSRQALRVATLDKSHPAKLVK